MSAHGPKKGLWKDRIGELTIAARPSLSLGRMTKRLVERIEDVALAKILKQHVTRAGVYRNKSTVDSAKIVLGHLGEIPVFEVTTDVAFAEGHRLLRLCRIVARKQG